MITLLDRFSSSLLAFFDRLTTLINRVNQTVFVFLLLVSHYLSIRLLDNEEQYLQLAKQFIDPGWIKSSFTLTEFPGTRLIFQYMAGGMLEVFSFEVTTLLGRLLLCVLFAYALGRLYRYFEFRNIDILFHLPILYFSHQSYFAREWIFLGFETKSFAYFFVLLAIPYVFEHDFRKASIFAVLATYFHVLVGGWFFVYFVIYMATMGERRQAAKSILLYSVSVLPAFLYLASEIIFRQNNISMDVDPDWIYTYFRNPHHTAIFKSIGYFLSQHAYGVLFTVLALIIALALRSLPGSEKWRRIDVFVIICFSGLLFFVAVAFFDRTGSIVKYYPFRIAAIAAFLFASLVVRTAGQLFRAEFARVYNCTVLLAGLFLMLQPVLNNIRNTVSVLNEQGSSYSATTAFIRENVPKGETILYMPDSSFDGQRDFIRKTQRERFVVEKFVPSGTEKLFEWYRRILQKEKAMSEPAYIPTLMNERGIHYFLATSPWDFPGLSRIYQNGTYYFYRKD